MALTADEYLNKMNIEQQVSYMTGAVEGLAQSRWLIDRPDQTGHDCVINWYFNGGKEREKSIDAWFARHLDKSAVALLYVLVKKECGEIVGPTQ